MTNLFLAGAGNSAGSIIWLIVLIGMIVLMLVLPSITQKKRVAAYQEMQSRLKAGDKVQTIGGIVGKIVRIKESNGTRTIFIETGDKNNKMVIEFDANAIAGVVEGIAPQTTEVQEAPAEEAAEPETVNVGEEEAPTSESTTEEKTEAPKKTKKSKK